ncbi:hypothetical protein C0Q70_13603 [Pomacea canaliculata]|uniref:Uncharacterized protein n=1 Tax=Pomacea canaliculata TaxID=400727 RepID=A0A2T7NXN9_POMCA|nr:hypothetical protein C0Q70_13603 [Pomacea canaliculata]
MTDYTTPPSAAATTGESNTVFGYMRKIRFRRQRCWRRRRRCQVWIPFSKTSGPASPVPPPWNTGLLLKVNWTSCVGQAVGQRLMMFMADRCNIHLDSTTFGPPGVGRDPTKGRDGLGEEATEGGVRKTCDTACHVLLVLLSVLVVVGVVAVTCFILAQPRVWQTSIDWPRNPTFSTESDHHSPTDATETKVIFCLSTKAKKTCPTRIR